MSVLATRVILEGLVPIASGVAAYHSARGLPLHPALAAGVGVGAALWLASKANFDAGNLLEARGDDVRPDEAVSFVSSWVGLHALIPLAALGGYGAGLPRGLLAALGIALGASLCVAWLVRRHYEGPPSNHVRRAQVKSLARMRRDADRKLPRGDDGLPFGGVMLPAHRANAHFCFIGSPGSGKSVSIQLLMQRAFPEIGAGSGHRAVVFDSKLDALPLLEGLGLSCPIRTLNPLDARGFAWKLADDVMSTLANGVGQYRIVASLWHHAEQEGRALSLGEFASSEGILVVGRSQVAGKALRAINQVIVQRLIQLVLEKGNRAQVDSMADRTWFILDEFKALGRLRGIEDLMTMGRSAGACVVLGFQDWRGLCAVYEENEAHELVGLCADKAFLRIDGKETARFASESIGDVEWYEESTGPSGESRSIQKRTRVLPNTFRELPKTSVAAGLHGYYMSDEDAWFAPLRGADVFRGLARPDPRVPGLVRREPADQRLRPLGPEDSGRLGIELDPGEEQDPDPDLEPDQEPEPDLVGQLDDVIREIERRAATGPTRRRGGRERVAALGRVSLGAGPGEREGPA